MVGTGYKPLVPVFWPLELLWLKVSPNWIAYWNQSTHRKIPRNETIPLTHTIKMSTHWWKLKIMGSVRLTRTNIKLLPQPKSLRSIIDATQPEQHHGSAWNWSVGRDVQPNKITPEWIYKANTKGPWSETQGPMIGSPRSCVPAAQLQRLGTVTPAVGPRATAQT